MKLGIALSGGGIRGIAHAGVLQALEDNNIKPDIIGGTSSGSMVAVLYAMGYSPYHIYLMFKRYAKKIAKIEWSQLLLGVQGYILNNKIVIKGCNNGDNIEEIYNKIALKKGIKNINQIKVPIVISAADTVSGKECVITNCIPYNYKKQECDVDKIYINDISIGKAVRGSSSFPGLYSPAKFKDYIFIDGGTVNNIPVDEVKKQGADKVFAVKFRSDEIDAKSNIMDVVIKSIDIMSNKILEENYKNSDYILEVYTDKTGLIDINKMDKCYNFGYDAVIQNIDNIKKVLES